MAMATRPSVAVMKGLVRTQVVRVQVGVGLLTPCSMNPLSSRPVMYLPRIESRTNLPQVIATFLIKELVQSIAHTDQPAFHVTLDEFGVEQLVPSSIYELIKYIPQFQPSYSDDYADRSLELFWTACQEIGLEFSPFGLVCLNEAETGYLSTPQTMNALVDRIRRLLRE